MNGEERELQGVATLGDLVAHLKLDHARVATELNLAVVPRAAYASTKLRDGDRLEIVTFVGGG